MIQTKLINILKQLPRTSAKGTEKVVNREAKSVKTIIDEFSLSDRAAAVGDAGEDALLSSQEDYSGNITDIDETPETLKKEPVYFDKKDKRFQYKDKDRETKEKNKKSKSQPISPLRCGLPHLQRQRGKPAVPRASCDGETARVSGDTGKRRTGSAGGGGKKAVRESQTRTAQGNFRGSL